MCHGNVLERSVVLGARHIVKPNTVVSEVGRVEQLLHLQLILCLLEQLSRLHGILQARLRFLHTTSLRLVHGLAYTFQHAQAPTRLQTDLSAQTVSLIEPSLDEFFFALCNALPVSLRHMSAPQAWDVRDFVGVSSLGGTFVATTSFQRWRVGSRPEDVVEEIVAVVWLVFVHGWRFYGDLVLEERRNFTQHGSCGSERNWVEWIRASDRILVAATG